LTKRQILKLAGHATALLIWASILLIIWYEVAGSIVRYGLTMSDPGYEFICKTLYLCD